LNLREKTTVIVDHGDGTKTITKTKRGITHSEMVIAINNNEEINDFQGGVILTDIELDELVPSNFPNSRNITGYDKDEEPIYVQKTWLEYSGREDKNRLLRTEDGNYLIHLGVRVSPRCSRYTRLLNDEFRLWVAWFGVDRILTKSEFSNAIFREDNEIL